MIVPLSLHSTTTKKTLKSAPYCGVICNPIFKLSQLTNLEGIMSKFTAGLIISLLSFSLFAEDTKGIKVGEIAPQITTKDINGATFNLENTLNNGPVVLVFYRGGWCPYCNRQLRKLQAEIVPELDKFNAKLVAISVDRLDEIEKTQKKQDLGMTLISDPMASIIKRYNVVNQTSDSFVKTYKESYGIDIEAYSGQKHHIIAVPAIFTISSNGEVVFSYANENYTIRAQNRDIISSLEELSQSN